VKDYIQFASKFWITEIPFLRNWKLT